MFLLTKKKNGEAVEIKIFDNLETANAQLAEIVNLIKDIYEVDELNADEIEYLTNGEHEVSLIKLAG